MLLRRYLLRGREEVVVGAAGDDVAGEAVDELALAVGHAAGGELAQEAAAGVIGYG